MPTSRNHFLKVANGKSDQATLSKPNATKLARAMFCAKNLRHGNDRDTRIENANRVNSEKIVRSSGFPCSRAWVASGALENPIHSAGGRDPRKNIQITGTHNAGALVYLAGSKTNSASRRVNQIASARAGFTTKR